ncbi:hypothetical protein [Sphingomonas sp. PP-CE-1G-424]|uniref:hypothetical protein n=1 Tax=Sphingomonas sp. PP-CE-1G-424 TaxID=2135658 RepID=UPI00105507D1|nr:hypothetical protein [Sphingomonas sp. PP-CE-1G-424]TCP65842.1 hypothetical protein C8J43_10844 [Sphingomonas sp. PP-CE-1G-424]
MAGVGPFAILLVRVFAYPVLPVWIVDGPLRWSIRDLALAALFGGIHLMSVSSRVRIGVAMLCVPAMAMAWFFGMVTIVCAVTGDCL